MFAVSDSDNGRIQVFHANGTLAHHIWGRGSDGAERRSPSSIDWSPSGDLLAVVDSRYLGRDNIKVLHADGTLAYAFGSWGSANGQFRWPASVAWSPNGTLLAAVDHYGHRVQIFDAAGNFVDKIGRFGSFAGQFYRPTSATWSPSGDQIIVSEGGGYPLFINSRIQVFHADGTPDFMFGSHGSGDREFVKPGFAAYSPNGSHIAVVDRGNDRIQLFDANGTFIDKFGSSGSPWKYTLDGPSMNRTYSPEGTEGLFHGPGHLAWSPSGDRIIVAGHNNERIQIFHANGTFDRVFGSYGSGDGEFDGPWAISFVPSP